MKDSQILALFLQRCETAIDAMQAQYGPLCHSIAKNLLGSDADAEECVNDTWHALWNTIPPEKPEKLSTFAARITRNLAMKQLTRRNAEKRAAVTVSYEELSQCIPDSQQIEDILAGKELAQLLDRFLQTQKPNDRDMFIRRYWFFDSTEQIARGFGISQTKVTTTLYRMRNKLKEYLAKEAEIYVR